MKVTVFPCGVAVNDSESLAIGHLKTQLQSVGGTDAWILLTNLAFSVAHQFQSAEIDIIAIGPPGVRVIEVKHWSAGWVDSHADLVEQECDKLTNKAKKIGTTLRRVVSEIGRVDGVMLLTWPPSKLKKLSGRQTRGVTFYSLHPPFTSFLVSGRRTNSSRCWDGLRERRSMSSRECSSWSPKIRTNQQPDHRRFAGCV